MIRRPLLSDAGLLPRLWLAGWLVGLSAPLAAQERLVLVGATLVDGTGAPPVTGARIIIADGRFACVSGPDGCPSQPGDRELALGGRWIIPGLIDTHVHLPIAIAPEGLDRIQRLRFALGITTVRDADSRSLEAILAARPGAEEGSRPVPRLVVAARVTSEYAERLGAPVGARLVERLAAMGVDAIKLKEPFGGTRWRDEIRAARAAGLPIYGHTWGSEARRGFAREAIVAGISGISHLMAIAPGAQPAAAEMVPPDSAPDPWAWHKQLWVTADTAALDSLITAMVDHGVWFEPTMATEYYWGRPVTPPWEVDFLRDPPRLRHMLVGRNPARHLAPPAYPASWPHQQAFVAKFIRRGGMVVAGSDGLRPGIDLHEEIRLIGEAAGSPMTGLQAATRNAARALNRPDLGTVEVGKRADLVVIAADPLGSPGATLQVIRVIKGGAVHEGTRLSAEFQAEYDARVRAAWRSRLFRGTKLLGLLLAAGVVVLLVRRRRP